MLPPSLGIPPVNAADDGGAGAVPSSHRRQRESKNVNGVNKETSRMQSITDLARQIQNVEAALKGGAPYLGTTDPSLLFAELSSLRREKNTLLEQETRLLERTNLLLSGKEDKASSTVSECEDERILQRVDSFGILIVVSTLITGFSIPTIDQAQLELTRIVMTIVFSLEMFATIFFSVISFYAKQSYNYGSTKNNRTASFLYHVRWVTFSAQACYTVGIFLFVGGILVEATIGYEIYWALIGVAPTFCLSIWCWAKAAFALIALRMGLWTHNLLLFDSEESLIAQKRATFIPAPTSFTEWFREGGHDGVERARQTR